MIPKRDPADVTGRFMVGMSFRTHKRLLELRAASGLSMSKIVAMLVEEAVVEGEDTRRVTNRNTRRKKGA